MERRPGRGRGPRPRRGGPRPPDVRSEPDPKGLVADVARWLAPEAKEVHVEERHEGGHLTLEVRLEGGAAGALIGRRGQTAQALRALLAAAGAKHGKKYLLEIRG